MVVLLLLLQSDDAVPCVTKTFVKNVLSNNSNAASDNPRALTLIKWIFLFKMLLRVLCALAHVCVGIICVLACMHEKNTTRVWGLPVRCAGQGELQWAEMKRCIFLDVSVLLLYYISKYKHLNAEMVFPPLFFFLHLLLLLCLLMALLVTVYTYGHLHTVKCVFCNLSVHKKGWLKDVKHNIRKFIFI